MRKYVKPIAVVNSNLAEGVYAASGDCYTVSANITQTPAEGRQYYVIHMDGSHAATDGHHSTQQMLTLTFNQPVTYVSSNGNDVSITFKPNYSYVLDFNLPVN